MRPATSLSSVSRRDRPVLHTTFIRPTPLGTAAILWTADAPRPVVRHILLPDTESAIEQAIYQIDPKATAASCAEIDALARSISSLLSGQPVRFSLALLALDSCPPFHQAVLRATARIPRGQVRTYGELAAQLGKPGAARAVGNAVASNPFPLVVPCHRVVRSGGHLGGFGGGTTLKRQLLSLEGIETDKAGRIPTG